MYFCDANPKRKESAKYHCFSNVFGFPEPRISTVFRRAQKNTSKISPKSTENRMTKGWAFIKSDLKSAKSTVFGSRVPKEWDFIFLPTLPFSEDAQKNTP